MSAKPPKIVIPGLNRGAGIPAGKVVGRLPGTGQGPAQLLDLTGLRQIGVADRAGVAQSTSMAISIATSEVVSLSTAISGTTSTTLSTAESYTDAQIAAIGGGGTGTPPNGVVSGLGVSYVSGLTFAMSAGSAVINGTTVTGAAQTTTLATADPTNPRIDVLYIDSTGTFGAITGTPAANPSTPSVDPTTQLYLAYALVPASATSLSGYTTITIYDEGVEWSGTTSGSGWTVNSTNHPLNGTHSTEGTLVATNAYVHYVTGTPISFDGDGALILPIESKGLWNSKRWITVQWFKAGVAVGTAVTVKEGSFGFSSSNTASYQSLIINKLQFAVPAGSMVDELRIKAVGTTGTAIGLYLDKIQLQTVAAGSGGSGGAGITQAQADARYEQITAFNTFSTAISTVLQSRLPMDGEPGEDGAPGPPGPPGPPGGTGAAGATGSPGQIGLMLMGIDGIDGDDGASIPGAQGPAGANGANGATGSPGQIGLMMMGFDGADGDDGYPVSGITGPGGDPTAAIGYLGAPQNSQSAAYTTVMADAGKHIFHPSGDANARTFTIDSNANVAYPIGTILTFVNMTSQVVTIAITSDTMYLSPAGTTGSRSLAQYGVATAIKMTSTTWLISGSGLT